MTKLQRDVEAGPREMVTKKKKDSIRMGDDKRQRQLRTLFPNKVSLSQGWE